MANSFISFYVPTNYTHIDEGKIADRKWHIFETWCMIPFGSWRYTNHSLTGTYLPTYLLTYVLTYSITSHSSKNNVHTCRTTQHCMKSSNATVPRPCRSNFLISKSQNASDNL